MSLTLDLAENPSQDDLPFFNYGTTDIPANVFVKIDGSHVISAANQSQQGIGVIVAASDGDTCFGITHTTIPAGQSGVVRCGGIAKTKADGSITAGTFVMASGGSSKKGFAKTQTTGLVSTGIALTTAADGEDVLVFLALAKNA